MKFAIDSAHRDFFNKQLTIEFEGFFGQDQIAKFRQAIRNALKARLEAKKMPLEKASSELLYMMGRDLWRTDETLRKLIAQSKLVDIASDLIEEKILRLGYDQYLPPLLTYLDKLEADHPYRKLLELEETTLEAVSCIQGVLCGMIICLQEATHKTPSFPSQAGNVTYINPQAPLNFTQGDGEYLFVVLTRPNAVYILQPNDPHTHAFKRLGYVFGDALSDKLNPILKR